MQQQPSGLAGGDIVRARGERWQVARVSPFADCEAIHLHGADRRNAGTDQVLLHPFDRLTAVPRRRRLRFVRRSLWRHAFRQLAAAATPVDGLRTAAAARLALLPYQLEPALAVVRGQATRLLIADEVGLGKTIQAGLIVRELIDRGHAAHVLVLTPAGLRDQWVTELAERFDVQASVMDAEALRRVGSDVGPDVNPWRLPGVHIASFDFAKRLDVRQALRETLWDVLVIDEAHAMTRETDRGDLARLVGTRSRWVVLLTATPHDGDDEGFASLCAIGRLAAGDHVHRVEEPGGGHIVLYRRSAATVNRTRRRRTHLLRVNSNPAERHMHALAFDYARRVWAHRVAHGQADSARLAAFVLAKRALSSARSLAASVARRLARLGAAGGPADASRRQMALPWEADDTDARDEPPDAVLDTAGLSNVAHERALLGALLSAALAAANRESKLLCLTRLIRRAREPVLVFTEYRDTLLTLARQLEPVGSVAVVHGGLAREARQAAIHAFVSGQARVLLATDAAGEGLNLQQRCRLVVTYELPWSPTRLEQRVGRVDRIGQRATVHALHLLAGGSAETHLLARLIARADRATASVGPRGSVLDGISEDAVAEAVLTDRRELWPGARDSGPAPLSSRRCFDILDLRREAERERDRLQQVRRLAAFENRSRGPEPSEERHPMPGDSRALRRLDETAPWVSRLGVAGFNRARWRGVGEGGPRNLREGMLCLFRAAPARDARRLADPPVFAVHVETTGLRLPSTSHELRREKARLELVEGRARAVAQQEAQRRLKRWRATAVAALRAPRARAAALVADIEASLRARPPVQAALFDRRAIREAERRQAASAALLDQARRVLAAVEQALRPLEGALELETLLVLLLTDP